MHAINPSITPNLTCNVAEVVDASDGAALTLKLNNGNVLSVYGHASMTPYLSEGDRVIFTLVEQSPGTAMILDRLRRPGEAPAKSFVEQPDHLVLETDKHILLKNSKALLALTDDGNLSLEAENILTLAKLLYSIKGQNVEIN